MGKLKYIGYKTKINAIRVSIWTNGYLEYSIRKNFPTVFSPSAIPKQTIPAGEEERPGNC